MLVEQRIERFQTSPIKLTSGLRANVSIFGSQDEGGGLTGRWRVWLCIFGQPRPRRLGGVRRGVRRTLHVSPAERRGERAAGRPREGRPDGEGAEGDPGGRRAVEEVPAHHQRDDRHQERTVTLHRRTLAPRRTCCEMHLLGGECSSKLELPKGSACPEISPWINYLCILVAVEVGPGRDIQQGPTHTKPSSQ